MFARFLLPLASLLSCADRGAREIDAAAGAEAGGDLVPDGAPDAAPASHVVLVAGGPSHGPGEHEYNAGAILLATMLAQTPGVTSTIVRGGWPSDPAVFDGASGIVFLTDGNVAHPLVQGGRMDALAPHIDRGAGFVCIHWSVHYPESASPRIMGWLGGHYSDDISVNPHWLARFQQLPEHPVTRGVLPFEMQDEWYYNMRFSTEVSRLTPILRAVPPDSTRFTADAALYPGRAETVAWTFERAGGGRSFGFTGAHVHRNWGGDSFRRLLVNAILWTAGREVPSAGAPVVMDPALLDQNLDPK